MQLNLKTDYNPGMPSQNPSTPPPPPTPTPGGATATVGLDALPAGAAGVITRMDETDHAMMIRLKTMGMHPGRAVRVLRQGSRLVVTCGGTRIGLSATVAEHVHVAPTDG